MEYKQARQALAAADPRMSEFIDQFGAIEFPQRGDSFTSLCRAIVGQQLSVKAAAKIYGRFEELVGVISPENVLALSEESARAVGLSGQKYRYLSDLAQKTTDGLLEGIDALLDDEVTQRLLSVKGIGLWTTQMYLMFSMHRLDIFPVDDLGIRRAIEKHYGVAAGSDKQQYIQVAERWAPYRTVACQYLWKSLDNTPK